MQEITLYEAMGKSSATCSFIHTCKASCEKDCPFVVVERLPEGRIDDCDLIPADAHLCDFCAEDGCKIIEIYGPQRKCGLYRRKEKRSPDAV